MTVVIYQNLWCILMTLLQGYNGSQLWDTAFAAQAIISTNLLEEYGPTLKKAHTFIKKSQVNFFLHLLILFVVEGFLVLWLIQFRHLFPCWLVFLCSEGFRWLPRQSWFLVSPHFKRRLAFLNCRSRLAHLRLHSRRIESKSLLISIYFVGLFVGYNFFPFIFQAALLLSKIPTYVGEPLDAKQFYDAVNVILSLQVACILII